MPITPNATHGFSYDEAFCRNLGWVTPQEQRSLRDKHVAIAGLGGVGGIYLTTLARLGVGRFSLAEFDTFEVANFNRQFGATVTTLGKPKLDVMEAQARDINPDIEIRRFPEGVTASAIDDFLADADVYLDGLDFFALEARELTFARCHERGIAAITVAPLGMGAALLTFMPKAMSFEQYFGLAALPEDEKQLRFLLGLSPRMLQRTYLVDPSYVDLERHRGPSTPMSAALCAGVAVTEALKVLLKRGTIVAAPRGMQFDAYRGKLVHTWRPWGHRNPLQRVALAIARRQLQRIKGQAKASRGGAG